MPQFRIIGAMAETGHDVDAVVTATNIEHAYEIASEKKIMVLRVVAIDESAPMPTEVTQRRQIMYPFSWPPQSAKTLAPVTTETKGIDRDGLIIGTSSLVLGAIAILLIWIPTASIVGAVLAGLGFLMGSVGLVIAPRRRALVGLPVIGAALCAVALVMSFAANILRGF